MFGFELCQTVLCRSYCWKIQSRTLLPTSTMHSVRRSWQLVVASV